MAITLDIMEIDENSANGTTVGTFSGNLGVLTLTDPSGAFTLVDIGGNVYELRVLDVNDLDYETAQQISISVADAGDGGAATAFDIDVLDVAETVSGATAGADTLVGDIGADIIDGLAGDDTIEGGAGADTMDGGDGTDTLSYENASSAVEVSLNNPVNNTGDALGDVYSNFENLTGSDFDDRLTGNSGGNVIDGGLGADTMLGGSGDDTYYVDNVDDAILDTSGTNTVIFTGAFATDVDNAYDAIDADVLYIDEAAGAAFVEAGPGDSEVYGNSFANYIDGRTGVDTLAGGDGNDTYILNNVGATVVENAAEGTDEVRSLKDHTLGANVENLTLLGNSGIDGTGNTLANLIVGNSSGNVLDGGAEIATDGGFGADTLRGGGGNDTYVLRAGDTDTIEENASEGTDTVLTAGDYTLGANLENAQATVGTGVVLIGNTLSNELVGGAGNDTLDGGVVGVATGERDTLVGGAGDDEYHVDNTSDVVDEVESDNSDSGGTDSVFSNASFTLSTNVENLTLNTGAAEALNATGNALDNTLVGNEFDNLISGGAGADDMTGDDGDDTYVVDDAGDTVTEALGEGTDTVRSSVDFDLSTDGDNVENLELTGSTGLTGTGNDLANTITGTSGADTILGNSWTDPTHDDGAVDTMDGGNGDDTYYAGAGDVVSETNSSASGGVDVVHANASFTLGNNIEQLVLEGATDIDGTGNAGANTITGNSGANLLDGQGGADTMAGGAGDDTFVVDHDEDVATDSSGNDTVYTDTISVDLSDATHFSGIENVDMTFGGTVLSSAGLSAIGTSADNQLTGNQGDNLLDGGTGADTLIGGDGDDTYVLGDWSEASPDDVLSDSSGTDTIRVTMTAGDTFTLDADFENLVLEGSADADAVGNDGNNVITGNAGANDIDGGLGADTMAGGDGDDIFHVDDENDVTTEAEDEGTDTVFTTVDHAIGDNIEDLFADTTTGLKLTGNALDNTIAGDDGNDTLIGGDGADSMFGGDGDDLFVIDGSDTIDGGAGTDTARSTTASIDLSTAQFTDVENAHINSSGDFDLTGTDGVDNVLTGGGGANRLDGGTGADSMHGGRGDDTYVVDDAGDVVNDGGNGVNAGGTDTIEASIDIDLSTSTGDNVYDDIENVTLVEGSGATDATGNSRTNVLIGNTAANTLDGQGGNDTMTGGDGDDSYYVNSSGDSVVEVDGEGEDTVFTSANKYNLAQNVENLVMLEGARHDANGNALDNVMTGNSSNNMMAGYGGADTMNGGAGNDTFIVNDEDDVVDGGDGTDWVRTSQKDIDLTDGLYSNVEHIKLINSDTTPNLNATGDSGNNKIYGNTGNNFIDGGTGDDTMSAGDGDDTYVVDSANDRVTESKNKGNDTINVSSTDTDFTKYSMAYNVETLNMGAGIVHGVGNGAANTINGHAGNNILDGKGGTDTMVGGDGDDTYYVGQSGDVVTENANEGTDTVISYLSGYTLADNVENMEMKGSMVTGTGNSLDNVITGNNRSNFIDGGEGADTLTGGSGQDTFKLTTADLLTGEADTITDFRVSDDTIRMSKTVFDQFASNGTVAAADFAAMAGVTEGTAKIIYDTEDGKVYYDTNGSGSAGGLVHIATLTEGLAVTNEDFVIIS